MTFEAALSNTDKRRAATEIRRIVGAAPSRSDQGVEDYVYHDENGIPLFHVERRPGKKFLQRPADGVARPRCMDGVRRVPYRLPQLIQADSVLIVEGEKDVHTLEAQGFIATTNPGGAGKWKDEYSQYFAGKSVWIIPDNDQAGKNHAEQVSASLRGLANVEATIIELPGMVTDKGDVTDWFNHGHTTEELRALLAAHQTQVPTRSSPMSEGQPDQPTAQTLPRLENAAANRKVVYRGTTFEESDEGLLYWAKNNRTGGEERRWLCNFVAHIVSEVTIDDGAEKSRMLIIQARISGRVCVFSIPAKHFHEMNWPMESIGVEAVVHTNMKERTAEAIQILSIEKTQKRSLYRHTGWREVEGEWVYLHGGGMITKEGLSGALDVDLQGALRNYVLPEPSKGEAMKAAIRSSLDMLRVAPYTVTIPVYAAVFRSVLGAAQFSIHLSGRTGAGKSQIAALAQQHFGSSMDATRLPAAWASTANALEGVAFEAKDALLTVDDFVPRGSSQDVQRLMEKAERLFRAQGNQQGRQRMRSDTSIRPDKPPRGLIMSTGESVPDGASLQARLVIVEIGPADVNWQHLTKCQNNAGQGLYAQALSSFIQWLAPQKSDLPNRITRAVAELRAKNAGVGHRRTPDNMAQLSVALSMFLEFAEACGAIDQAERVQLVAAAQRAFADLARAQDDHQHSADPCKHFEDLLITAIRSGSAHLAQIDGNKPANPGAWGWRLQGSDWTPRGPCIGWLEGNDVYLLNRAALAAAQDAARESGDRISFGVRTLGKRLKESGMLARWEEKRGTATIRKVIQGKVTDVLHVNLPRLCGGGGTDKTDHEDVLVSSEEMPVR